MLNQRAEGGLSDFLRPCHVRAICWDYTRRVDGQYVYTLKQIADRWGISLFCARQIYRRHGLSRTRGLHRMVKPA